MMKQHNHPTIRSNRALNLLGCFCAACMLFVKMEQPAYQAVSSSGAINGLIECMRNLAASFDGVFFQVTLAFGLLVMMSRKIQERQIKRIGWSRLFSGLMGLMWTCGKAFAMTDDLHMLIATFGQAVKSILFFCGSCWLFDSLLHLLRWFLDEKTDIHPGRLVIVKKLDAAGIVAAWKKHPFAVPFVCLLIVWFPYVLVSYPGNMGFDSFYQISQYFGLTAFTAHHPPLLAVIMGMCVKLGRAVFHSANAGLFLYVLIQYVSLAAAMAYTLSGMQRMKVPKWLPLLSLFVYGLMPVFSAYAPTLVKDVPYTLCFVVLLEQIIMLLTDRERFAGAKNIAVTVAALMGTLLFRNNGTYVVIPFLCVLLVKFAMDAKRKAISRNELLKMTVVLLIPVVAASGVNALLKAKYDIAPGSIREAFSIPFQQTARYVRDHEEDVTPEEREAIDKVLNYDKIGALYDEAISDPVKNTFRKNCSKAELAGYFKVWFVQFFKHPVCYVEATLNQNYYLFYPFDEELTLYRSTTGIVDEDYPVEKPIFYQTGIREFQPFSQIQSVFVNVFRMTSRLPFFGLLCSLGFYTIWTLCLMLFALDRKNAKALILSVPLLLTLLVVIASPIVHVRYVLPIIYAAPLFSAFFLDTERTMLSSEDMAEHEAESVGD